MPSRGLKIDGIKIPPGFDCLTLVDGQTFLVGSLPARLVLDTSLFEELWGMHPAEYHEIRMRGRQVPTPRWQQAYGIDYHYTEPTDRSLHVSSILEPFLA